jgi:hypothetical protein
VILEQLSIATRGPTRTMTLRYGRSPPGTPGAVKFLYRVAASRTSWPTALAQSEGDRRRDADQANYGRKTRTIRPLRH